jgi:hypothetical protein
MPRPMPTVNPRGPASDLTPDDGWVESLDDWYRNNKEAVEWFLVNAKYVKKATAHHRTLVAMLTEIMTDAIPVTLADAEETGESVRTEMDIRIYKKAKQLLRTLGVRQKV